MSTLVSNDLTYATKTHTGTSVPMGTREEHNCEVVEAAVFRRHGNEQRCQIQHLVNGEETAERADYFDGAFVTAERECTKVDGDNDRTAESEVQMHTTQYFEGAALPPGENRENARPEFSGSLEARWQQSILPQELSTSTKRGCVCAKT